MIPLVANQDLIPMLLLSVAVSQEKSGGGVAGFSDYFRSSRMFASVRFVLGRKFTTTSTPKQNSSCFFYTHSFFYPYFTTFADDMSTR